MIFWAILGWAILIWFGVYFIGWILGIIAPSFKAKIIAFLCVLYDKKARKDAILVTKEAKNVSISVLKFAIFKALFYLFAIIVPVVIFAGIVLFLIYITS